MIRDLGRKSIENDAQRLRVLMGHSGIGGIVTEGPGIDLVGPRVGIGGDTILLYDSGGNPTAEYAASDAGLTAALAAMGSGDVIELPDVTISGGPWTVANGTMKGHSRYGTILDGEVTILASAKVERLSINISGDDAGTLYAVILGASGKVEGCMISIINATGIAVGVTSISDTEGDCYADDNDITATGGSYGYAFAPGGPNIYATGGKAVGSTAPVGVI